MKQSKIDPARLRELNGKPWDSLTQEEKQEHNTLAMTAATGGKRSPAQLQERADTEGWESQAGWRTRRATDGKES